MDDFYSKTNARGVGRLRLRAKKILSGLIALSILFNYKLLKAFSESSAPTWKNDSKLLLPEPLSSPVESSSYAAQTIDTLSPKNSSSLRQCHVVIMNKVDFHHEVIESVVLNYDLPWEKFDCDSTKPIKFDFSLLESYYEAAPDHPMNKDIKDIKETEYWGWKLYFEKNLKNRTFPRVDGKYALFNQFLSYSDYEKYEIDAHVDVTCDIFKGWKKKIDGGNNFFCVLHRQCDNCNTKHLSKVCYLAPPMWPKTQCAFLPTALPKFTKEELLESKPTFNPVDIRVCVPGGSSIGKYANTALAQIFSQTPFEKYNVNFFVTVRAKMMNRWKNYKSEAIRLYKAAMGGNFQNHLSFVTGEKDYTNYAKSIATCDIIFLEGKDPAKDLSYFKEGGLKKLTGSIPQIVAYEIPAVMHVKLFELYRDHLTAPVETFESALHSKTDALIRMIEYVASRKKTQEKL